MKLQYFIPAFYLQKYFLQKMNRIQNHENLSEPLKYSLSEFENGKIHVKLQINGVKNTVSEIKIQ